MSENDYLQMNSFVSLDLL